jgi:adenylyl-sulfate kinase
MKQRSPDVVWSAATVTREERWSAIGQRGGTVWFTGLPASGKSTLAAAVEARLVRDGLVAYRIDGDNLRHGLSGDLGFSLADRAENVRRAGEAAKLLADAGVIVIVSLVSPLAAGRNAARSAHQADDLPFVEVWVSTPLEECERRDPKGLYARARSGEMSDLTGIGQPYEAPESPDLDICPGQSPPEADVESILSVMRDRGIL